MNCLYCQCSRIQNIISSCARSIHTIRTLRVHGMCQEVIQIVCQSVVVAKLTYAANAWWDFAAATDRQRVEAVIRRGVRPGLCLSDILTAAELIDDMDDDLFQRMLWNMNHVGSPHSAARPTTPDLDVTIVNWFQNSAA